MLDRKRSFGLERLVAGRLGKSASPSNSAARRALAIFRLLLNDYHPRDFTISFWDGSEWPAENGAPRFTLRVRSPAALRRMLMTGSSDLSLSESYIAGELDVTGDFEAVMPLASYLMNRRWRAGTMLRLAAILLQMPIRDRLLRRGRKQAELSGEQHSIQRDRQAVTYHYSVSNQFYALWLDSSMVYSCAYFETEHDSLDAAQTRKLDYLCRKLKVVEEPIYRIWQLFLHGTAHAFAAGLLNVYQSLLVKPDAGRSGLPLARTDWYRSSHR